VFVAAVVAAFGLATTTVPQVWASDSSFAVPVVPTLGVDVDVAVPNRTTDQALVTTATKLFSYLVGLGANAVSLNFPFYMSSPTSSKVLLESGTPPPPLLRTMIEIAEADGLQVQLRPLIKIVGGSYLNWRGVITPSMVSEWFQTYWQCLEPYAILAAQTGVTSISIAAELNSMIEGTPPASTSKSFDWHNYLSYWEQIVQQAQSIVGSHLVYSSSRLTLDSIPGTTFGYDAYAPVVIKGKSQPTASTATAKVVSEFTSSMEVTFHQHGFPALTAVTLEEVGIAAYTDAWRSPYLYARPKGAKVARWVQADWDTAMCDAFLANHMAGIYFWEIYLAKFTPSPGAAAATNVGGFVGTSSATAISACFARARVG
jgi:hypothetical protein